jgi:hypothetical protein
LGFFFSTKQSTEIHRLVLDVHTGEMLAYPIGGKNAGSMLTLLVAILGVTVFWKNGRRKLAVLLLMPFQARWHDLEGCTRRRETPPNRASRNASLLLSLDHLASPLSKKAAS